MGIVLKDILAILPEGKKDIIQKTSIYVEGNRIVGIGNAPAGFQTDKVIDENWSGWRTSACGTTCSSSPTRSTPT